MSTFSLSHLPPRPHMCFIVGSIDQVTKVCPLCQVFPHPRCPHVRDVCRNRANHPNLTISFLKNAEVESFNGCGYCKWARASTKTNNGWPGCCRAPTTSEHKFIQLADWKAISIIHHVPTPPEIKSVLDSATSQTRTKPAKSPAMPIPMKSRVGGSPQMTPSSIAGTSSRSLPSASHIERPRHSLDSTPASSNSSPNRKHVDLDPVSPRRNSGARPPTSTTKPKPITKTSPPATTKVLAKPVELPRPSRKLDIETSSTSSSGSDSISSGSYTESTVTSDGGFTDYLSSESEEELQRQAEAKAAVVVQNEAEENEFRMARQMLANITTRPPRSWLPDSERARVASTRG
ncbi:WD-REPEATS-REGION domain-containing protein [Mycena indigotica]|uniref:WD-REPEATS-REGION domain-containing protein n=1 Tax=Mycena indigotica TaxID=2126181 RepID=A0A8H6SL22_9AGAR|nr:WD-REPEATS-REGION domain-containing protein [Mycena indigotica]KAF7301371.1 WD-REPEATS-REGION domain-containing protein [Mycena indigotica]